MNRKVKRGKKEKRLVPKEVKILLGETQKARGKKYRGYILKARKESSDGSGNGKVAEVTEAELLKNLWTEISKKNSRD